MSLVSGFYRDGSPAGQVAAARFNSRGKAENSVTGPVTCGRCGGAGGADKWKPTGWTCFDCGGAGKLIKTVRRPIYTAEALAKLNAAAEKRAAKLAAKAAAERQAAELAAEAFRQANAAWLAEASAFAERSEFVRDVLATVNRTGRLTDGQRAAVESAIAKMRAADAARAASTWLGEEGARVTFTATVERVRDLGLDNYGNPREAITLRTTDGQAVTYFGYPAWRHVGTTVNLTATVKARQEYRGEKQTVIARPRER